MARPRERPDLFTAVRFGDLPRSGPPARLGHRSTALSGVCSLARAGSLLTGGSPRGRHAARGARHGRYALSLPFVGGVVSHCTASKLRLGSGGMRRPLKSQSARSRSYPPAGVRGGNSRTVGILHLGVLPDGPRRRPARFPAAVPGALRPPRRRLGAPA